MIIDFEEKITSEVGAIWASQIAKRQEFRQNIVTRKFLWHYLENVEINLNEHIESFSQNFDEFEYQLKLNEISNTPVDPSRPPWKIYFFPNIANRGNFKHQVRIFFFLHPPSPTRKDEKMLKSLDHFLALIPSKF